MKVNLQFELRPIRKQYLENLIDFYAEMLQNLNYKQNDQNPRVKRTQNLRVQASTQPLIKKCDIL